MATLFRLMTGAELALSSSLNWPGFDGEVPVLQLSDATGWLWRTHKVLGGCWVQRELGVHIPLLLSRTGDGLKDWSMALVFAILPAG